MSPPSTAASTPRSFSAAHGRLTSAQKPGPGVPAYTRWVNRRAGRVLAAACYTLGMRPDGVTLLSGAVSLVGIALLALAPVTPAIVTLVVLLLLLAYALDSADGQVARLTGTSSPAGEWLDHVVDAARLPAFHLAVAAALYRTGSGEAWPVILGVGFALLASTWFFAQILAGQLAGRPDHSHAQAEGQGRPLAPAWVSFAKLPSDIGTLYLLVGLLPWRELFLAGYLALFAYSAALASVALRRRYLELR